MLTPNLAHRKLAATATGASSSAASSPSGSPLHINKSIVNPVKLDGKTGVEKTQKQSGGGGGGSLNRNLTLPKQYFKQRFGSKKLANKSSSTQIGDDKASPRLASSSLSNSISGTTNTTYSTSSSSSSSSFSKESSTMINSRFDHPAVNDDSVSNNEKLVAVHVDNLLRSVKYLEQIVLKNKYEIVGSTVTAILESVVDLYNQIRSFGAASTSLSQTNAYYNSQLVEYSGQLHAFKSNINQTLADLVKWSDQMFLYAVDKTNQTVIDARVQENSSNQLNKILVTFLKSINDLVDFYKSQSDELNSGTSKQLTNTSNNSDVGQVNKLVMRKRPTSISSFDHSHRLLFSPSGSSSISSNFSTSTTSNQARPPSQHLNTSQPSQNLMLSSIAQPVITVSSMNEGNKTIELKTSRNFVSPSDASTTITQTNTLITTRMIGKNGSDTTTTVFSSVKNGENSIFIKENDILDLSAFMDIDKLAVELSQSSSIRPTMTAGDSEAVGPANLTSTLNNDTCNYLVEKFETFARDFSNKKLKEERERREIVSEASRSYSRASSATKSPSPMPGTPVSKTTIKSPLVSSFKKSFSPAGSPSANSSYSPSRISSSAPSDRIVTTLYKKSTVKHDLDNKSSYIESKEKNNKESVISRVIDETVQNDTSFVEENSVNDKQLAKLVLDVEPEDENDDQVVATGVKKSDDTDSIDNECDSTAIHRILLDENNSKYHKSHLRPNFLVIKDEFDENYEIGGCGDSDDELVTKGNSQEDAEIFDLVIIEKKNTRKELDDDEEEYDYDLDDYKDDIKIKNKEESVRISKQESSIIKSNSLSTTASLSNSSLSESMMKQSQPAPSSPTTQSPKSIMKSTPSRVADSSDKIDILGMLDVTHLLEYQLAANTSGSSSVSSSSYTSLNTSYLSNVSHSTCDMSLLRGGNVDALVVLATSSHLSIKTVTQVNNSPQIAPRNSKLYNGKDALGNNKNNFLFQEAFLTTYRTIMEPIELVEKLIYRYRKFAKNKSSPSEIRTNMNYHELDDRFDMNRLKINNKYNRMALLAARNSLTLLVRVIDDLENDVDPKLVKTLLGFIAELVIDDELQIARLLRKKLLNKLDSKRIDQATKEKQTSRSGSKTNNNQTHIPASSAPSSPIHTIDTIRSVPKSPQILPYLNSLTKRCFTLLDFRSSEIAEQMTLVDLNLFSRIELPEVLLWSTKQSEQYSPNLIRFTEHFNSISYWARSRILEHETYKDREKYLLKFVKIMKHLRKLNNFNSYLSILSAVDSGPIQRLDWPKVIIDEIQDLSQLVDPKCGFKMLREAIAQSQPPCIPHIGLILQDLTMLHIANPDYLPSGNCNFWKRWQQYNILERLRYFKRCNYGIKPNSKIQELFNDFKDFIGEDAQYNISEQLKPRTKPTTTFNS